MNKRLLILTDSLSVGGAERQLSLLVKYLPDNWERRVWSLGSGIFSNIIRESGTQVYIHERSWRWDVRPSFGLWRLIIHWRPHVIHSYGYMGTLAALPIAKAFQIPLIGSIRKGNVPIYRGGILKWSLKWPVRVIANSQAGLNAFGIEPERGRIVHNGFDPNRLNLCSPSNAKLGMPFTVIMVGRMQPEKDYQTFIAAARILLGKDNKWQFVALGAGELRETLMQQAKDLIECGKMLFEKQTLEVLPHVSMADVGVLMTTKGVYEGFSNAIMEYMSCSLPVVCSDSAGNRELVLEGKTGFLVPAGEHRALADRLLYLRNNPEEVRRLGQAGRRRLETELTIETMIKKTVRVYEEIV